MRELIKPGLFWVARLGLFLAVVAWGVGQCWQGLGFAFGVMGVVDPTGIAVQFHPSLLGEWGVYEYPDLRAVEMFLDVPNAPVGALHLSLNVLAVHIEYSFAAFGIKHWVNVTIFAAFYALLKFFFRRRPESPPCEV